MKTPLSALSRSEKFELIVATIVMLMGIIETSPIIINQNGLQVEDKPAYFFSLFQILTLYGLFILNNFKTIPSLIKWNQPWVNLGLLATSIGIITALYNVADHIMTVLFHFSVYEIAKYAIIFLHKSDRRLQQQYALLAPNTLLIAALYIVILMLLILGQADPPLIIFFITSGLYSMGFYLYSYQVLLPKAYTKKKPLWYYIGQSALLLVITALPVGLVGELLLGYGEVAIPIFIGNALFQFHIFVPFSWVVYRQDMRTSQAFNSLKKEANRSAANVRLLHSQINPHFLFNILNTLYGTAIQEGAERTAAGVQKLGDMMRFMLHENLKETIRLSRELDYIRHYIDLQSLRISHDNKVVVRTEIEDYDGEATIAPMLLIPFIENAFKHGISLREPSFININLKADKERVLLDVQNSIHSKAIGDTEADKSGIGLDNVRQRLNLSYPDRHRLDIEETKGKHEVRLEISL